MLLHRALTAQFHFSPSFSKPLCYQLVTGEHMKTKGAKIKQSEISALKLSNAFAQIQSRETLALCDCHRL